MPTLTPPSSGSDRDQLCDARAFPFPARSGIARQQEQLQQQLQHEQRMVMQMMQVSNQSSLIAQALRQPSLVLASALPVRQVQKANTTKATTFTSSTVIPRVQSATSKDELDAASVLMSFAPEPSTSKQATPSSNSLHSSRSAFRPFTQAGRQQTPPMMMTTTTRELHQDDWLRHRSISASADFEEEMIMEEPKSSSSTSSLYHPSPPQNIHRPVPLNHPSSKRTSSTQITPSVSPHPLLSDPQEQPETPPLYNGDWVHATSSLYCSDDDDVLSPLHCFMRKYCVEAFTATPDDEPRYGKSHGVRVVPGQVGIRCMFCKHQPAAMRSERAVCFPSTLKNIYHSIETWQRRHSIVCQHIPSWIKTSMTELLTNNRVRAGGRRQYWEDSAKRLGLVDTPNGVRFCRAPGELPPSTDLLVSTATASPAFGVTSSPSNLSLSCLPCGQPIVREEDKEIVTDFLYLLLQQMETCSFSEEDRSGGRSKIKNYSVGYPGMQCKHCKGKAGFGRYFPATLDALALANSDRNVFNHLQKCRKCPDYIKNNLKGGFTTNRRGQSKNKRGNRKVFFKRVWERIHEGSTTSASSGQNSNQMTPIAPKST